MAFRLYSTTVTSGLGVWPHPGCQPGCAEVAPWGGGLHTVVPGVLAGASGPPEPQAPPPVLRGECEWTCGQHSLRVWRAVVGVLFSFCLCEAVASQFRSLVGVPAAPCRPVAAQGQAAGPTPSCPVFVLTLKPALGSAGSWGCSPHPCPGSWALPRTHGTRGVWAVSGS